MARIGITSPWIKMYYEINEMFRYDKDVSLIIYDDENKEIRLYVDDAIKAEALQTYLPGEIEMGNITLRITIVPSNQALRTVKSTVNFEDCFKNNEAVEDIVKINVKGFAATYIVFKKCVVQYFNDNLGDLNGLCSTLYQDIANNIFVDKHAGVFFCTSNKEPNDGTYVYAVNKPFTTSYATTIN